MNESIVLTVLAEDKTGIVESLASAVKDCGGNWLESRMCRLGGQFAGILKVEIPAASRSAFDAALEELRTAKGMAVQVETSSSDVGGDCAETAIIEIVGHDRPGIVSEITAAFAKHGVNVEDLSTELVSAPMSGELLFQAKARICIPEECDSSDLREDLEEITSDLMVDLNFDLS